ncbi:MAG TPA: phosphoglycerate kinase [Desulfosalsimonadaceae bacterium]|nr:phosphoglycerate kinase [Desulfosalsimonadaceae bacterium]
MRSVKDIEISGKKILVRVDVNVPMDDFQNITDDTRIREVLPTLRYVLDHDGILIVCAHMDRPKGKVDPKYSLAPVAKRLGRYLKLDVQLAPDCVGNDVRLMVDELKPRQVLLLENLRFHNGEQDNDDEFAKELASLCDVYVNDAFAVCHREHASVSAITRHVKERVAGFLLLNELKYFHEAMENPRRPLVAIIGGAKVSSKIRALNNMLGRVNKFIIGGAMANTFLKSKGYSVGKSRVEDDLVEESGRIMKTAIDQGIKFYLPVDAVVAPEIDDRAEFKIVPIQEIPDDWMALDIGPATSRLFEEVLYDARTVIWNGPMGIFEIDAFSRGTVSMVHHVANSYALTIVGGGDTDVAIHTTGQSDRFTYISTGGGAFLQLMEGKPLPGVAALETPPSG